MTTGTSLHHEDTPLQLFHRHDLRQSLITVVACATLPRPHLYCIQQSAI